ncbi:unnamed protein product, partial [Scytosiphon promiscuus]
RQHHTDETFPHRPHTNPWRRTSERTLSDLGQAEAIVQVDPPPWCALYPADLLFDCILLFVQHEKMRSQLSTVVAGCVLPSIIVAEPIAGDTTNRPNTFKRWRQDNPPKMIVFGDSNPDTGRRYNAPASFQFEEYGIGPVPWKRLYDGSGTDTKTAAYRGLCHQRQAMAYLAPHSG